MTLPPSPAVAHRRRPVSVALRPSATPALLKYGGGGASMAAVAAAAAEEEEEAAKFAKPGMSAPSGLPQRKRKAPAVPGFAAPPPVPAMPAVPGFAAPAGVRAAG